MCVRYRCFLIHRMCHVKKDSNIIVRNVFPQRFGTLQNILNTKGLQTIKHVSILLTLNKRQQGVTHALQIALKRLGTIRTIVFHMGYKVLQSINMRHTTPTTVHVINWHITCNCQTQQQCTKTYTPRSLNPGQRVRQRQTHLVVVHRFVQCF